MADSPTTTAAHFLDPTTGFSHRRTPSNGATSEGAERGSASRHNVLHLHHTGSGSDISLHSNSSGSSSSSSDQKRQQNRLVVTNGDHGLGGRDVPSQEPLAQVTASTTTTTTTDSSNTGAGVNNSENPAGSSPVNHGHQHHHGQGHKAHRINKQTLLTKALLTYLNFFRVVQPIISLAAFGTITPVLAYFRTQTIFPTITATLYLFTATLACCSLFFSIVYLIDVLYHKPLFWPFTNRHFRRTSRARIGGDLIVCMVFSGLWFLSGVGLVIDTVWVDCGRLVGLEGVFLDNHRSVDRIAMVCRLEKATLGLAVISWACWMGVLLVLLYGHFWKRRQVIAERLRDRLARRRPTTTATAGTSSAVAHQDGTATPSRASVISGRGVGGSTSAAGGASNNNAGLSVPQSQQQEQRQGRQQDPSFDCQDMEGEVGLTGVICRYDDEEGGSTLGQGSRRSRPQVSI